MIWRWGVEPSGSCQINWQFLHFILEVSVSRFQAALFQEKALIHQALSDSSLKPCFVASATSFGKVTCLYSKTCSSCWRQKCAELIRCRSFCHEMSCLFQLSKYDIKIYWICLNVWVASLTLAARGASNFVPSGDAGTRGKDHTCRCRRNLANFAVRASSCIVQTQMDPGSFWNLRISQNEMMEVQSTDGCRTIGVFCWSCHVIRRW